MIVKHIVDEDFVNYKTTSMLILFHTCSFKCGRVICQNNLLTTYPDIDISIEDIVWRYTSNQLSRALVLSGLEPFDSYDDLIALAQYFRRKSSAPIVIYSGYTEDEITNDFKEIYTINNVIIKFGRYIPGHKSHFDNVLGVSLSSDNQYAKQIS